MEFERKIIENGNSLGILLPNDIVKFYGVKKGDTIIISDDEDKITIRFKDEK